ncbi:MAG TPA: metallophosphoesterase, partial [Flavobacterium sp.]|nr:metallophosphoesterase [Flavobacterium sp.]
HEVVVVGDAGNADEPQGKKLLQTVEDYLKSGTQNQTLLFTGDNIYPLGMPKETGKHRPLAEEKINAQINLAQYVNGSTVFIPGNHDWYRGLNGLIRQKDYIELKLGKKSFMPRKYRAVEALEITDDLTIITIDSEWFIQNWDRHPDINEESFVKTREDFFEEFRSLINKNQNKITLVAIHHPILTNGLHGGYFSLRKHLFPYKNVPLPVLGSVANYLLKTTGASPADIQHSYYRMLVNRLKTLTKDQEQVVFVSGHEHNLQYIEDEGVKQLISGAGSKTEEARSVQPTSYSSGNLGFATLKIYDNNQVDVAIHKMTENGNEITFQKNIIEPVVATTGYSPVNQTATTASVYPEEATQKSRFYRFLFGEHYRSVFGTKVYVPVADLSKIQGGLTPVISGGGNQSLSLRLKDSDGRQYVMRGLRKSSKQFLQVAIFKDTYIKDQLDDMFVLDFIDDHYTTSHPYVPFITGHLSDAVQLYHTNPKLYFVPKQNVLGRYNQVYGDELYMIEERPHKSQKEVASFGNGEDIISTQDLLVNLEKDEKYRIDTEMYLRARIFDFLIGDWDRHADQWRWAEKTIGEEVVYQPIPRDRDQAFAKLDGNLLRLLNRLPALRHMQHYTEDFAHPRWINKTAFPLDKVLLQNTTLEDWQKTADYVANSITDEVINETFDLLPKEVQEQYTADIIRVLKKRRSKLVGFSADYYRELFKYATVVGTNKKDTFIVKTTDDKVAIEHIRNKKSGDVSMGIYTYYPEITKEIWIYGLDDDDHLTVLGDKSTIKLKLIGGRNNDVYNVQTQTATTIFDYKSKNNTLLNTQNTKNILRDQYQLNQYDYRKTPMNIFSLLPNVGYNKDNGTMLGVNGSLTVNKFNQNPYTQKHNFGLKYDFATSGLVVNYQGSFKDYSRSGFWTVEGLLTSSNFSRNFFGNENLQAYNKNLYKDNYYRVRTSQLEVKPSYEWKGRNGSSFLAGATYESTKIVNTNNRLIDDQLVTQLNDSYNRTDYLGARLQYQFENYDDHYEPTIGLAFSLLYGTRFLTDDFEQNNQYLRSKLNFVVPLTGNKKLTWSSSYLAEKVFGTYHFYQAASIGQHNGLRGYRQQRFTGEAAFVTSQDLRFKMQQITNAILPLSYGIYAGYDAGKVWSDFDVNNQWYHSYGGGFWLNAMDSFTAHIGAFSSKEERVLISFGAGFGF